MTGTIDREKLVTEILANRSEDLLVVCGLGSSTYDVASIGDNSRNFYLWGAMGQAVPVGIGLAVAQPDKRVLVITGDGEMLMGLGALSAAGNAPVRNLSSSCWITATIPRQAGSPPIHQAAPILLE